MTGAGAVLRGDWRRAFMALAFLGMSMKVLVPPGMMVGPADGARIAAIPLVICTGRGPAIMAGDAGPRAPGHKSRSDAPCAFAGHAVVANAPISALFASPDAPPKAPPNLARFDLSPGRGLAAPPPPSQGPPNHIL